MIFSDHESLTVIVNPLRMRNFKNWLIKRGDSVVEGTIVVIITTFLLAHSTGIQCWPLFLFNLLVSSIDELFGNKEADVH